MVKELEDAPRDEIAVLLDADASAVVERQLRRAGARGRLDPARARLARPPRRAGGQLGRTAERAGHVARRATGWPRSACSPRRSRTGRAPSSSCSRARAARRRARSRRSSSRRGCPARSRRGSCSARSPARASASSGSTRQLRGPARRRSSRSCCGCRLPASRWRSIRRGDSLAAVLGAAPAVTERACLGRSPSTLFPAALIALGWLRLEEPRAKGADWVWVVLLALVPALAPTLWLRLALIAPAALTAAWVALDTPAIDDRPGFFAPVLDRFANGFVGYYDVTVPFSAVEQQRMHGVLLLAIFGFCVVLAQSVAARRPLPALLAVIAGAGWPATLYPSRSIAYGAIILAAALWVLAGLRTTRPVPALVAGAVLVLVAAGASSSAARRQGRRARVGAVGPERGGGSRSRSATCGKEPTAGSSSRRTGRRCCGSPGRGAGCTGGRRRSTSSTRTAGSRIRLRSRPDRRAGGSRTIRSCPRAR